MASNQSAHFQLNLWEPGDDFLRTEFNANFTKLDEAARVVAGTYTGNCAAISYTAVSQFINLGFTPRAVLVMQEDGKMTTSYDFCGGLALPNAPAQTSGGQGSDSIVTVEEGGFRVYSRRLTSSYSINANMGTFHYWAVQ